MVQKITRGQALFIDIVFKDENGNTIIPSAASLRLAYSVAGARVTQDIVLSAIGDTWSTVWDTSPADAGQLFWWAHSNNTPHAAVEGCLKIEANPANPQS